MDYKEAVNQSRFKKIAGLSLTLIATMSTGISLMRLIYFGIDERTRIANASLFKHNIYVVYKNTRFLDWFWEHCPKPNLANPKDVENIFFLLIYYAIFLGLAMYASGREIGKEISEVEKFSENYLFDDSTPAESEIEYQYTPKPVTIPESSVFAQFIPLCIIPVMVTLFGGVLFKMIGLI